MIRTLTDEEVDEFVKQNRYAVVVFDAPWDVGPGAMNRAELGKAHAAFSDQVAFGEIDVDIHATKARRLHVANVPTVVYYRDSKLIDQVVGVHNVGDRVNSLLGVGMTDATPKPKRKRWRWLIAGVLLFVLAVSGWWQRPRLEQRIVGKWNVRSQNVRSQVDLAEFQGLVYEFRADGKLLFGRSGNPNVTRWGVQGDRLIIGDDGRFYPLSIAANFLASLLRSPRLKLNVAVDEIIAVGDNEITLRIENGRRIETLSRASGGASGLRNED